MLIEEAVRAFRDALVEKDDRDRGAWAHAHAQTTEALAAAGGG